MNIISFFLAYLITSSAFTAPSQYLITLKSKFPNGLLGNDYGILTVGDLALNACRFKPRLFPPTDSLRNESASISVYGGFDGVHHELSVLHGFFCIFGSIEFERT